MPRQPFNYIQALHYSLRLLQQRSYSEFSLRRKLAEHGVSSTDADQVVAKLQGLKLINDPHYAEATARSLATYRHASNYYITQKLRQKGVDRELVATTIQDDENLPDELERAKHHIVAFIKKHKLAAAHALKGDPTLRQKCYTTLARKGFSLTTTRIALETLAGLHKQ